jgi:ribosomal protein L7Ae-like RNA K-turn-binding protein
MGHDAAKGALRRGQAKLCLVCADASARLAEEFRFLAEDTNTPLRRLELTSLDMKAATQYKAVVLTIDNRGFAEKITGILEAQASTA